MEVKLILMEIKISRTSENLVRALVTWCVCVFLVRPQAAQYIFDILRFCISLHFLWGRFSAKLAQCSCQWLTLKFVLHMYNFGFSLRSVSKTSANGLEVSFTNNSCAVQTVTWLLLLLLKSTACTSSTRLTMWFHLILSLGTPGTSACLMWTNEVPLRCKRTKFGKRPEL